jgi:hypothetical protein
VLITCPTFLILNVASNSKKNSKMKNMTGNFIVFTFDIEHFQLKMLTKARNLAFREKSEFKTLPEVLKIYEPFETTLCEYYLNKIGQVVSFYQINQTLSEDSLYQFYLDYDKLADLNRTHKKVLKDINNTFGINIEPDTVSILSVDKFEEEKIKWDHCRISNDKFQTFIECQFIYQLGNSFNKNLMNYQKNHNSYYHNKIMWNLSPSFFSVGSPREFLINDDEIKDFEVFYKEWNISTIIKKLSDKFNLLMRNSQHKSEKSKNAQQNILNFFLLSLTIFSTIKIIPVLAEIFPGKIDSIIFTKTILWLSLITFSILFFKPIIYEIKKAFYFVKNIITFSKIKKNKV